MAHALRFPNDLPVGPRRTFVVELHKHYKAARRPTLREISDLIRADDELRGTAGRETIRRMLLGEVVPASWHTVDAVFLVLCRVASRNPHAPNDDYNEAGWTWAYALEQYRPEALDEAPTISHPLPDDEPPF
jgi:hypothetical protein